jgi:hypothetical protein
VAIASLFVLSRLRIEECRGIFFPGAKKTTAKSVGFNNLFFPLRQFADLYTVKHFIGKGSF